MCPYYPYCVASHEALQCVRLTALLKEHREAIDRNRKICLRCREGDVDADGICGWCRDTPAPASELNPPAAPWPRPDWTVLPEAVTDRDFYECIALSGVARFNPGPTRATVKEISILFDYKQEHTILYRGWLDDMDVELFPTEPRTVTTAMGRSVEARQIAIIPLQPAKKEGRAGGDWGVGSGVGHVKQGEGPDDQEPEEEVHGEADHPQGSYSQKAANDRSCDWERQS